MPSRCFNHSGIYVCTWLAQLHSHDSLKRKDLRLSAKLANDYTAVYLVGGGIASLAAAAFLIRDGNIVGRNITILEESPK